MATQRQKISNKVTGEQITFLQTASDTNGDLLQIKLIMPANQVGVPAHIHSQQEERFTVMSGTLHATLDGKAQSFESGETLVVKAGQAHSFSTKNSDAVEMMVELRPALDSEHFFTSLASASEQDKVIPLQVALLTQELNLGFYLAAVPKPIQHIVFPLLAMIAKALGYQTHYNKLS